MATLDDLRSFHELTRRQGERLAGGLSDLAQRAAVYHHLFDASGGNHAFPLIAAHGALWAKGYFRYGMRLGAVLSFLSGFSTAVRHPLLDRLNQMADAFREINRRVCVDTYTSFHFTARYGEQSAAAEFVPAGMLEALRRIHTAIRRGHRLPDAEKREVFEAFFLNEQQTIVGPSITAAVAALEWPLMRRLALRPTIRFAYFPAGRRLRFADFSCCEERVENGLRAFAWAAEVGWSDVVATLRNYAVMPEAFFRDPAEHFNELRLQTA